jgi:hypothetical protein
VPVEAIRNFGEKRLWSISRTISTVPINQVTNAEGAPLGNTENDKRSFNPPDKMIELYERNDR